jgi:hypothetical protein
MSFVLKISRLQIAAYVSVRFSGGSSMNENISEVLDMIAAQMKVIQIARIRKSCLRCENPSQVVRFRTAWHARTC